MSLQEFARCVFQLDVVEHDLPKLIETFGREGVETENIEMAEGLIFLLFPLFLCTGAPHFKEQCNALGRAFIAAARDQITKVSQLSPADAERLIVERLKEYANATFERKQGSSRVSEYGLARLARRAWENITSKQALSLGGSMMVCSHFTASISSYGGGTVLKKQYELYMKVGPDKWASAHSSGISEANNSSS